jgi:hypothetical protein
MPLCRQRRRSGTKGRLKPKGASDVFPQLLAARHLWETIFSIQWWFQARSALQAR